LIGGPNQVRASKLFATIPAWGAHGPILGISIPVSDQPLRNCQFNNIYFMVTLISQKTAVFSIFDDEVFHFHALQGLTGSSFG